MSQLTKTLSHYWAKIQGSLFPWLEEELDPLTEKQQQLVAIPLATITGGRIDNCYDLMDSAYDVPTIIEHSQSFGHVPLIDKNPRRNKELKKALGEENLARKTLNLVFPETLRYNARSTAERTNSRLKDEHRGDFVSKTTWKVVF